MSPKNILSPMVGVREHKYKLAEWKPSIAKKKYAGYIEYKCYHDTLQQEMYRVREYLEYAIHATERIEEINKQLKSGFVLRTEGAKQEKMSLEKALEFYREKKHTRKERSMHTYKKRLDLFEAWAKENNLHTIAIDKITKAHTADFLDYSRKLGNCEITVNAKLLVLTNFFNLLVDKEVIESSPIAGIKRGKGQVKNKTLIKKDEMKRFSDLSETEDIQLYCFINFLYHNHIRPNELRQLQRKHIDLETDRLTIPEHIAKNGNTRHTIITPPLRDIIIKYRLDKGNQEHCFFGHEDGTVVSQNYWGARHLEFRRKHEFTDDVKLYRWKDVGVTAYYMKFKDAYYIMRQCGHNSLEQTQKYLSQDLGIFEAGLDLQNSPTM